MALPPGVPRPKYFAYGSNLWLDQMRRRCPDSKLLGVGVLRGWKWIISERGYANIIPSTGDSVYGLVWDLSEADEATLDIYENVPVAYEKEYKPVEYPAGAEPEPGEGVPPRQTFLIYIDHDRLAPSTPKHEYIYRINRGIDDAVKLGIPQSYFDEYVRPFIPADAQDGEKSHAEYVAMDKPSLCKV